MIEFRCSRFDRHNHNTPILSDRQIDEFAHAVLADYRPRLLKEPGRIRFEHFLESYLGVNLEFQDIYNEDPDRPILGATAFNDERLRVFDRENMRVSTIAVTARTVIIDNSVMEPGKEGLALFTGLHEGGHVLMHAGVYTSGLGNEDADDMSLSPVVCCRRENIESTEMGRGERTAVEWREHHANYFAAALAMPNTTFKPVVNQMLHESGVWKGQIVLGVDEDLDIMAEYLLPEHISEVFGVSRKAASIKLRKTGVVIKNRLDEDRLYENGMYGDRAYEKRYGQLSC